MILIGHWKLDGDAKDSSGYGHVKKYVYITILFVCYTHMVWIN